MTGQHRASSSTTLPCPVLWAGLPCRLTLKRWPAERPEHGPKEAHSPQQTPTCMPSCCTRRQTWQLSSTIWFTASMTSWGSPRPAAEKWAQDLGAISAGSRTQRVRSNALERSQQLCNSRRPAAREMRWQPPQQHHSDLQRRSQPCRCARGPRNPSHRRMCRLIRTVMDAPVTSHGCSCHKSA